MARAITKTQQIGVRFEKDLLEGIILGGLADSPQKALNLYERSYIELVELRIKINNQPENKVIIEEERESISEKNFEQPLTESDEEPKKMTMAEKLRLKREEISNNKK
jgi:hypothetical protein